MNYMKTAMLLIALTLILVWVGGLVGGRDGAFVAFLFALVINGVSYWFSDKIIIAIFRARQVSEQENPKLFRIVRELTLHAKIPMPKLYVVPQAAPNAFATGRDPRHSALCVTNGILELLGDEELKGVLAHELAHVKNRDTLIMTVAAAIAGAIMMLANMARWASIFGGGRSSQKRDSGNAAALLIAAIIAPIAAIIVQLAVSRSREYAADRRGAIFAGTPTGLANALKHLDSASRRHVLDAPPQVSHLFIVNPFRGGFLTSLFSTHPPITERVRRLEAMRI